MLRRWCFLISLLPALAYGLPQKSQHAERPRVLILGDSHLYGHFGTILHRNIAKKWGGPVTSLAVCPAAPMTYMKPVIRATCGLHVRQSTAHEEPATTQRQKRGILAPLKVQIAKLEPQIVVIALGTNMGALASEQIRGHAQLLLKTIRTYAPRTEIIWLGPPAYSGSERIATAIQSVVRPLAKLNIYLDGRAFNRLKPLPRRNPHFGRRQAGLWAEHMFLRLDRQLLLDRERRAQWSRRTTWLSQAPQIQDAGCTIHVGPYRIPNVAFMGIDLQKNGKTSFTVKNTEVQCETL